MIELTPEMREMIRLELGFRHTIRVGSMVGSAYGYSKKTKLAVTVNVEFRPRIDDRILELSFTGEVWKPRAYDCVECGQILYTLREGLEEGYFVPRLPKTVINKMLDYWELYHLNTIKPVPEDKMIEYLECVRKAEVLQIPKSEYYEFMKRCYGKDYGRQWYKWKIPNSVYRWILAKLCGKGYNEINRLTWLKQLLEGDVNGEEANKVRYT